jgi:hypothetical protein
MNGGDGTESDWGALRALGRDAGPEVAAPSAHVTTADLARIRASEETPDLESAYRHVAACAACRARLLEAGAVVAQMSSAAERSLDRAGARRLSPQRATGGLLAASAIVALVAAAIAFHYRDAPPLGVLEREVVETNPSDVPPGERDVELSFPSSPSSSSEEAAVFVVDRAGRPLAGVQWFTRAANGQETVMLSPRTFLSHQGKAFGFVLAGENGSVRRIVDAFEQAPAPTTFDTYVASLNKLVSKAGRATRIQKIAIGR